MLLFRWICHESKYLRLFNLAQVVQRITSRAIIQTLMEAIIVVKSSHGYFVYFYVFQNPNNSMLNFFSHFSHFFHCKTSLNCWIFFGRLFNRKPEILMHNVLELYEEEAMNAVLSTPLSQEREREWERELDWNTNQNSIMHHYTTEHTRCTMIFGSGQRETMETANRGGSNTCLTQTASETEMPLKTVILLSFCKKTI